MALESNACISFPENFKTEKYFRDKNKRIYKLIAILYFHSFSFIAKNHHKKVLGFCTKRRNIDHCSSLTVIQTTFHQVYNRKPRFGL